MKFSISLSLVILLGTFASVTAQEQASEQSTDQSTEPSAKPSEATKKKARIVFYDNFSGFNSFQVTNTNGDLSEPGATGNRLLFPFASESVGGKLSVTATSDIKTTGPDEKPGVLAFTVNSLPQAADFFGLVYMGRQNRRVKLSGFNVPSEDRMRQMRITFRYRAGNA